MQKQSRILKFYRAGQGSNQPSLDAENIFQSAPFMTLSFMALLVIPHLKLGDLGLFDGDKFALL